MSGPQATEFVLRCIRQKLLSPTLLQKIEARLASFGQADGADTGDNRAKKLAAELKMVENELAVAKRNLARANSDEEYGAISSEFARLSQRQQQLHQESIEHVEAKKKLNPSHSELDHVREIIRNLAKLATEAGGLQAAGELIRLVDAKLYLAFEPVTVKKRMINKIKSGVVTFGDAPPPIDVYRGPTSRKALKELTGLDSAISKPTCNQQEKSFFKPDKNQSIGNVSRGGWTAVELFLLGSEYLRALLGGAR